MRQAALPVLVYIIILIMLVTHETTNGSTPFHCRRQVFRCSAHEYLADYDKTWEQMWMAYEREARQIWIVNVGDLKPLVSRPVVNLHEPD